MRVHGCGPTPCLFMIVGEGPGWEEAKRGIPFVGRTGKELDTYLDGYRLPAREDIFITNLFREFKGSDYEYTTADVAVDESDLLAELRRVQPRIIITLGRHSTRWFLGDVDMDDVHAMPWVVSGARWGSQHTSSSDDAHLHLGDEEVVIFPIFHPAAGFHNPSIQGCISYGFEQCAQFLESDTIRPRRLYDDPHAGKEIYIEDASARLSIDPRQPLALDTEGTPARPWSLQYSQAAGSGVLVRDLRRLTEALARHPSRLIFHNALHDLSMLQAMGVDTRGLRFDDTMVKAYLLQVEPQGLKALCVRHCNMRMQSYDDVMGDMGNILALDYAVSLAECEQVDYAIRQQAEFEQINQTPLVDKQGRVKHDKQGHIKYRQTRVLPAVPKTPLHKAAERIIRSNRPRTLWLDQKPEVVAAGIACLGPLPEPTLDHVAPTVARHYACRDADGTVRLNAELDRRLDAMGLREVYELEMSTYPFIARMAQVGIKPDLTHFARLSTHIADELACVQIVLDDHIGAPGFNANSGDQVAAYIFDTLGLEGLKKTREGRYSTNDKVLEALERAHPEYPVLSTIRTYRELYKLKHTFVDSIPDYVHRWPHDERIHATFRTTRVVTGRLASSDPNLLAQPVHGALAKEFQRGWVADDGHVFGSWDLSQIELRVLAHLSQDPYMLAVYRGEVRGKDGKAIDLHAALAQRIFGVPPHLQDKSKHRLPAKAINFGIPMGMTEKGLTVELRKNGLMVSESEAKAWLDETLDTYRGVRTYQQAKIAEARRNGYIRCLSGRIRYIGGIKSPHPEIREEAERFAFSTPIQEGAQLVMKTNEASIWKDILVPLWRQGRWIEPILQIHDDIKMEMDEGLAQDVHPMMVAAMTTSYTGLSVPIETSGEWGRNLRDMEGFA